MPTLVPFLVAMRFEATAGYQPMLSPCLSEALRIFSLEEFGVCEGDLVDVLAIALRPDYVRLRNPEAVALTAKGKTISTCPM